MINKIIQIPDNICSRKKRQKMKQKKEVENMEKQLKNCQNG